MSADRELLELAAKAIGLTDPSDDDDIWRDAERGIDVQWNPLTDDGDALRLAVKLRIHLGFIGRPSNAADRVHASPRGLGHLACVEMFGSDDLAATRRAIVMAAAEIGRAQ